jgi:hypothetical protein
MKTLNPAAVSSLVLAAMVGAAGAAAPGEENKACESQWAGGDFVQFSCPLPTRATAQRWRFKADFSGGHDDTSASMTLTLDEAPLECATGSKTRLFGEDGDVSLVCHFRVPGASGTRPTLGVALLWSHAQYVRTELVAE